MKDVFGNSWTTLKHIVGKGKSSVKSMFSVRKNDENPYDIDGILTRQLKKTRSIYGLIAGISLLAIIFGSSTPFGFIYGALFGYSAMNTMITHLNLKKHLKTTQMDKPESDTKKLSKEEQLAEDAEQSRKIVEEHQHMAQREMDPQTQSVMNALFAAAPEREEETVETVKKDETADFNSIFKK